MKKSLAKRIRITKNGKIVRRHMGSGHNGSRKTKNHQRRIGHDGMVHKADSRLIYQEMNRTLHLNKAARPNKVN